MRVVSVKNLSVSYSTVKVFEDISLDILEGDYIALAGPNGSGKSTLIRAMLGLIPCRSGSISLFETPLKDFVNWHHIGYIPQRFLSLSYQSPYTVKEVVSMGLLSSKRFPKRLTAGDEEAVDLALKDLDILALKDFKICNISGGELQRVLIARAIVNKPRLLFLDEPTNAIDPQTRERFFALIKRLNTDYNTTVVLVTHDTGSIGLYAKKLLYFDSQVVFYGTFEDFCHSSRMSDYFGLGSQHIICQRHHTKGD